ncbi:hypothetical protein [Tenacibaculum jejuense]|uniref:Uncharacterized protein n=1 Tax=Tenacibaculum jejuense TaxID=584609 RepID=A0A238U815_9FLAO|nr:hypothetical protein [Tenacibaculum jejuense]SNR15175.1 conserved protein of unknown function [Tenacibaculum jejuense]
MSKYNKTNFFKHTYCQFEYKELNLLQEENINFKSKSGSSYVYTEQGVYRYSNHWGRVANCRWKLNGIPKYQNQNYYVGYAKWTDFFSLTSEEKLFSLKVNFETKKVIIYKPENSSKEELFDLTVIFKKKKEVEEVFKNTKWMQYYDEEVEVLQEKIIRRILTSNKSLREIKLELS